MRPITPIEILEDALAGRGWLMRALVTPAFAGLLVRTLLAGAQALRLPVLGEMALDVQRLTTLGVAWALVRLPGALPASERRIIVLASRLTSVVERQRVALDRGDHREARRLSSEAERLIAEADAAAAALGGGGA